MKKNIVIGAGIVGVSTAIWLKRSGHDVTLIDKGEPGMGTSYGNAGVLASCAIVPVTGPGLIQKAPKILLDPDFPLFMRWSYLPKLLPFLAKYLSYANAPDTTRIAKGIAGIIGDSLDQHQALAKGTDAEDLLCPSEYSFAYKDRAAFDADSFAWKIRAENGFVPEITQGLAVREREAVLSSEFELLATMKNHGFILNPANYVAKLCNSFHKMGGQFIQTGVKDFELDAGKITAVLTDDGRIECDKAIIATGAWSKPLMRKLGLKVPLETERGYHIIFKNPSDMPSHPIMITTGKFVATPMNMGLRCAGIVEFGGLNAGPSKAPFDLLRRQAALAFPNLTSTGEEEWMGHRPATADSLPLVGEIGQTGVYTALGHQHIGLTGGPKTGRLIAGLIDGNHPNIDMSVYSPNRYL